MGEIIPIQLSFGSRLKRRYQVDEANYDRSGRMNFEHFIVAPPEGAEDPLAEYFSPDSVHIGGGLRGSSFLATKPWTIQLDLNEWVRFIKPGEYKLKVASSRVELVDSSKPYGTAPATAISNDITLKILPRDPEWEKRTYDRAIAVLRDPASRKRDEKGDWPARRATEILRYLGTREATRELAKEIRGDDGYFPTDCFFGLIGSPERAVARELLDQELARPDRPIDDRFLNALIWFEEHDTKSDPKTGGAEERALEKAMRALPNKGDEILPLCLYSLVDYTWIRGGKFLPNDADRLIEQLFAIFDRLTPEQKHDLLSTRWENIRRPSLLPLLKRYAGLDFSQDPQQDIHYNARTIAALALRRWFELDPEGARPAVIAEISRPIPRFGVRDLGYLPDKSLPGVDRLLAEHFHGDENYETASNFASLIARYGTREILPQILRKLDAKIGHWGNDIENPLLAYVLRVDPEAAGPRVEKALVARAKTDNGYNQQVFQQIAAIHYDPVLEQLAIRALDDSNRAIASSAVGLLARYGSDAARAALHQRYEKWCKRWAGREAQINLKGVSAQYLQEGGTNELILGRSLARALATAGGWLTDETELQRLRTMTRVATIQHDFDLLIEKWHSPLHLVVSSCGPVNSAAQSDVWQVERFNATVVQYLSLDSLDELKEKLSQFPAGTKFELYLPWEKTNRGCIEDLRAFLTSHEFSVIDAKIDDGS